MLGRSPARRTFDPVTHSTGEWVWRREEYQALFQKAPKMPYDWKCRSICTPKASAQDC